MTATHQLMRGLSAARSTLHLGTARTATHLPPAALRTLQEYRLHHALRRANRDVPYYRELFDSYEIDVRTIRTLDDLDRLPITRREDLLAVPIEERTARGVGGVVHSTSGSTGDPLKVRLGSEDRLLRRAADIRALRQNGMAITDLALFITKLHGHTPSRKWFQRGGVLDREYMDASEPTDVLLRRVLSGGFEVLVAPTDRLVDLADEMGTSGRKGVGPKLVVSGGELLYYQAAAKIEAAFGVPPIDFYGLTEAGRVAWQCPAREGYHINADLMAVEVMQDGYTLPPGEEGELVITHFFNRTAPLIRYATGDLGVLTDEPCSCGCTLPRLVRPLGRLSDCVLLPNSVRVSPWKLTCCIEDIAGLRQFHVVQTAPREIVVEYESSDMVAEVVASRIRSKFRTNLGNSVTVVPMRVEEVSAE